MPVLVSHHSLSTEVLERTRISIPSMVVGTGTAVPIAGSDVSIRAVTRRGSRALLRSMDMTYSVIYLINADFRIYILLKSIPLFLRRRLLIVFIQTVILATC